jgi:hypothetical protein
VDFDDFSTKTISNVRTKVCLDAPLCPPWPKNMFSVTNAAQDVKVSSVGVPSTAITNLQLVWHGGISADIR